MIDWSKLEAWGRDKYRSFEELCYQIARGLYDEKGRFTPIDDRGGGDGIEFYMALPNGDQWGWQAKFYYPNPRLSVSNRKRAIQDSLKRACEKHPRLRKWILCTPTKFTESEQSWFENTLPQSIPQDMDVELIHWGDSDLNNWLSEPRFGGKRHYFFGELELTLDWFRTQVNKQIEIVGDKFNPALHTETAVDDRIHSVLGDKVFARHMTERVGELENQLEEYRQAVSELSGRGIYQIDWNNARSGLLAAAKPLEDALTDAVAQLKLTCKLLREQRLDEVSDLDWDSMWAHIEVGYDAYREEESAFDPSKLAHADKDQDRERALREAERMVHQPAWAALKLMDDLHAVVAELGSINETVLHIFGDAGVGKTHIASHICHSRLKAGLPALMVLGCQFTSDRVLSKQLLDILDVPATYGWHDFLQALAAAAEAYHTRIPLVIDGLNEATVNGIFSNIWRLGLPSLIREVSETKKVVLVATCRTTYRQAIWPEGAPKGATYAYGFGYEVETAIDKYFTHYRIKADLTAVPLSQFQRPVYLRIFCESKNRARQEETHIYVGEHTLLEVFDEYLEQANGAICDRLGLRPSASVVMPALRKMAEFLWEHHCRSIPLEELIALVDAQPLDTLKWESSKTKALLDESLLVCRDWLKDDEIVYFTYDLLGGYLIARYLVQRAANDIGALLRCEETVRTLFGEDYQVLHPLYSDIRRCLAALLPVEIGQYLHDLSDNPMARSLSIEALFEIPPHTVSERCVDLVAQLFENPQNRKLFFGLAASTVGHVLHPLNASFWSERLLALPMPERDISWTEYVRENIDQFEKLLARFEASCQGQEPLSKMTKRRLRLLAEHIMWALTSTVRPLRDKATRALYWYGRRLPEQFFDLVLASLGINDPYVSERMLAAAYGVAMARQYDFDQPDFAEAVLPVYARRLYEWMFKPSAPYATTHILASDYARRTIETALTHHPDLLTAAERKRITPPFRDGGIRKWGESVDRNDGEYRNGDAPIHMDFENYTLGRLVRGRSAYDFEHEEYKKVRANIFWRIYDLGYSLEAFGQIDRWIARWGWYRAQAAGGGKTDRYGKKYSWIAFYELAGFRQDQGSLPEWSEDARIADADIDPSFPVEVQQYNLIRTDLLGDREVPADEWILHGDPAHLDPYLIVDELCGEQGPWVLLDGYINQEDAESNRARFVFPRGFIVRSDEAEQVAEMLTCQDLRERSLPEIPEDYYTYAGEIPWCDTYPRNGRTELSFVSGTRVTRDLVEKLVLFRDDEPIPAEEEGEFWDSVSDRGVIPAARPIAVLEDVDPMGVIEGDLEKRGLEIRRAKVPIEREVHEYQRFEILLPVRTNNWEYYHSAIIPPRSVMIPAKEIAEHLGLCGQPQTFDLFEKGGRRASITFRYGDDRHTAQKLTYLRQDLLERFLSDTKSELIYAIWGERETVTRDGSYKVFQDTKVFGQVKNC